MNKYSIYQLAVTISALAGSLAMGAAEGSVTLVGGQKATRFQIEKICDMDPSLWQDIEGKIKTSDLAGKITFFRHPYVDWEPGKEFSLRFNEKNHSPFSLKARVWKSNGMFKNLGAPSGIEVSEIYREIDPSSVFSMRSLAAISEHEKHHAKNLDYLRDAYNRECHPAFLKSIAIGCASSILPTIPYMLKGTARLPLPLKAIALASGTIGLSTYEVLKYGDSLRIKEQERNADRAVIQKGNVNLTKGLIEQTAYDAVLEKLNQTRNQNYLSKKYPYAPKNLSKQYLAYRRWNAHHDSSSERLKSLSRLADGQITPMQIKALVGNVMVTAGKPDIEKRNASFYHLEPSEVQQVIKETREELLSF